MKESAWKNTDPRYEINHNNTWIVIIDRTTRVGTVACVDTESVGEDRANFNVFAHEDVRFCRDVDDAWPDHWFWTLAPEKLLRP